jgi:hypothetical protein
MSLGQMAYEAYCECLNHLKHPAWTDLTADEKIAWQFVAETLKRAAK